ncbi:MAG: hypothetical protein QOI95_80 [Acidimicrobiaceae bacterium]|jgi:hypothetical protein
MQSDLLDVVIGVVFTWFLLSTVLSAINEGLALVTHARAKHLWLGIGRLFDPEHSKLPRRLLDIGFTLPFRGTLDVRPRATVEDARGPTVTSATSAKGLSPDHLTVRPYRKLPDELKDVRDQAQALYNRLGANLVEVAQPGRLSKVTRLAASAVSDAMVELAGTVVTRSDLQSAAAGLPWEDEKKNELVAMLAQLPDEKVVLDSVLRRRPSDAQFTEEELRELYRDAASRVSGHDVAELLKGNPELASAIKRAADGVAANERVVAIRGVIEKWFEREMDQLSAFYRRQNRKILAALALPLVLFCHANSIAIFQDLRNDASLRQATLAAATTQTGDAIDTACAATTTTTAPTTTTDPLDAAIDKFTCARDVLDRASAFRVGLAWQELQDAHGTTGKDAKFDWFSDAGPYLKDAVVDDFGWAGRLVTLTALLFGAEFWFDTLRRLIGLRGYLKPGAPT